MLFHYNLGKRVPGMEFVGKRSPGMEFVGKRSPITGRGKRVPGMELVGKRSVGLGFAGKRDGNYKNDYLSNNDILDKIEFLNLSENLPVTNSNF